MDRFALRLPDRGTTFGGFLVRHAFARAIIPAKIAATRRRLLRLADTHPDLAEVYKGRAIVFAERESTFDPKLAVRLATTLREEAIGLLDRLERHLADGRNVMVPPDYSAADVVWTVFLARMELAGMGEEIAGRPALTRYWQAMKARRRFVAADIWTKLHVGRLIRGIIHGWAARLRFWSC